MEGNYSGLNKSGLENLANLIINTAVNAMATILNYETKDARLMEDLRAVKQQLLFILLGGRQWREKQGGGGEENGEGMPIITGQN